MYNMYKIYENAMQILQKRNAAKVWIYDNATDAIYKNAVWSFVIERLLLLRSSKRLRLEVLCILQKLEYKFLRKTTCRLTPLFLVLVEREKFPHILQRKATEKSHK